MGDISTGRARAAIEADDRNAVNDLMEKNRALFEQAWGATMHIRAGDPEYQENIDALWETRKHAQEEGKDLSWLYRCSPQNQ